jgi:peptide/nickel transport system permease protein
MLDHQLPASGESAVTAETEQIPTTRGVLVMRRFARRKIAVAGVVSLALLFVLAFVGPRIARYDHEFTDENAFLEPPSAEHWFGTTGIGQDVFAQTLRGLQKSLVIGFLAALLTTGLAGMVGASAGYFGGWVDRAISWFIDLLLVIPVFFVIIILSPKFRGKSWLLFVVLLSAFGWMVTARVIRSLTLSLKDREFVRAARYIGVPSRRIIARHILPNMSSFLIIGATLGVGGAILSETGLSFLGFGIQPPDVSLGSLIATGTQAALTYPWLFMFSGGLLILTVLSVSVVGDGLRDALDPRLK